MVLSTVINGSIYSNKWGLTELPMTSAKAINIKIFNILQLDFSLKNKKKNFP